MGLARRHTHMIVQARTRRCVPRRGAGGHMPACVWGAHCCAPDPSISRAHARVLMAALAVDVRGVALCHGVAAAARLCECAMWVRASNAGTEGVVI